MTSKTCTRCLKSLPITSVHWYDVLDGKTRRSKCKPCFRALEQAKGWERHSVTVHKRNDKLNGLYIESKHITVNFLKTQFIKQQGRCIYPHCKKLLCTKTPRYAKNSLSIERLSNWNGHHCDNVVLCCLECQTRNKKSKRKYSELADLLDLEFPRITSRYEFKQMKRQCDRSPCFV